MKTFYFCDLEYVEYKPFESSDMYSFGCKRLGRKGGIVHVVQFGTNEYFGIAMRRSDAERLVMEIKEKMYESTD